MKGSFGEDEGIILPYHRYIGCIFANTKNQLPSLTVRCYLTIYILFCFYIFSSLFLNKNKHTVIKL